MAKHPAAAERNTVPNKKFLLYCDDHHASGYFIRLGLGIFWECGPRDMAKEFSRRSDAVRVMQSAGKHRQGWRVLVEESA